jgi:hypothetical protein
MKSVTTTNSNHVNNHNNNKNQFDFNSSSSIINFSNDSFVTVKFGNNSYNIFNSNCKVYYFYICQSDSIFNFYIFFCFFLCFKIQVLLENIRLRSKIKDAERIIDLSDIHGNLLNLRDEGLKNKYATTLLKPRQILVLIEVKNTIDKTSTLYTPLLENKDIVNESFMLKLLPKTTVTTAHPGKKSSIKITATNLRNHIARSSTSTNSSISIAESPNVSNLRRKSIDKKKII